MGEWNKNLVLSHELIKVELPRWKIKKADVSSVSPSSEWNRFALTFNGLTIKMSAFQIFHDGNLTFINSFDKTKFLIIELMWTHCSNRKQQMNWTGQESQLAGGRPVVMYTCRIGVEPETIWNKSNWWSERDWS